MLWPQSFALFLTFCWKTLSFMRGLANGEFLRYNLNHSKNTSQEQKLRLALKRALSTRSHISGIPPHVCGCFHLLNSNILHKCVSCSPQASFSVNPNHKCRASIISACCVRVFHSMVESFSVTVHVVRDATPHMQWDGFGNGKSSHLLSLPRASFTASSNQPLLLRSLEV